MNKKLFTLFMILMPLMAGAQNEGSHFKVRLTQAGSLKARLTSAVFDTDYDLVDSLTISGKMGGADFAYLNAQEGLVSQLSYLDLADVELVYDDEPYHSFQRGSALEGSIKIYTFFLSAENREDGGGGGINEMNTSRIYEYRNNLAAAFRGMENLKTCILPKSLKGLGEYAFAYCKAIEKVTLPDGLTYIGDEAFMTETSGLNMINLPSTVDSIGATAFYYQPIGDLDFSHVSRFGRYCLEGTNIKTIQLNDKVKTIPECMFYCCGELTSISIPGSVETICKQAFLDCGQLATVTMGEGIRKIEMEAFKNNGKLNSISFPSTIEEIGSNAFDGVPAIENLPIEGGVKYIGRVAYKYASSNGLKSISIKEGTFSVADAFTGGFGNSESAPTLWWGSSELTSIILPSTLRILGRGCFAGSKISSITLPESLETIGDFSFYDCANLRRVTIPANVQAIKNGAFGGSCGVVRVYYNAVNAQHLPNVRMSSSGPYYDYTAIFGSSVSRVIISEGVKTIPANLFMNCKNITRVQMPSTIERIEEYAFKGCTSLVHIDFPSSLKFIAADAFLDCNGITSVTSYMKEPFPLWTIDEEELRKDWKEGTLKQSNFYGNGPFGGVPIDYVIDQQGELHLNCWSEFKNGQFIIIPVNPQQKNNYMPVPLLQVPNGMLETYQNDFSWASTFKTFVNFDGASDAEAITESTTVNLSRNVTEETDLSGSLIDGIFVTLDTEDSGDGYDATEGCIVINSQTAEESVTAITADDADDLTVKNLLSGLVFEVPAGKGKIIVDCQTLGSRVLFVKIGNNAPQKVSLSTRNTMTINYDVKENTRVFIYAANDTQTSRSISSHRAAYANDDAVKIYGLTISVDEKVGIIAPAVSTAKTKVYKLVEKGSINILLPDGRKYSVKGVVR